MSRAARAPRRQRPTPSAAQPVAGAHAVSTGTAELVPDPVGGGRGWTVMVNGVPSSYVDLDDQAHLAFEYMRWVGDVLDTWAPPGEPLRVAHLGGAGCSLPRYVAATRPGSPQVVFEPDEHLVALARSAFGLRSVPALRLRVRDGRLGVQRLPPGSQDAVVRDAFAGATVPAHLATVGFLREVARALDPSGVYVANVADGTTLASARVEAATALAVFRRVALVVEPGQLRGRRYGNVLVLASHRPLPLTELTRRLSCGPAPARVVTARALGDLVAGCAPRHDDPRHDSDP